MFRAIRTCALESSSRTITKADEGKANGEHDHPRAEPDLLQGAKATPFPSPHQVHSDRPHRNNDTDHYDEDSQLPFGDHVGVIIAHGDKGATTSLTGTAIHAIISHIRVPVWPTSCGQNGPGNARGGGETVDAGDLKSSVRKDVWVRIPPALLSVSHT